MQTPRDRVKSAIWIISYAQKWQGGRDREKRKTGLGGKGTDMPEVVKKLIIIILWQRHEPKNPGIL